MGKAFLILPVILLPCADLNAQPSVTVSCDRSWGPGRYNKVSVIIDFDASAGFAKFSQDYSVGLEIIKDKIPAGDFSLHGNRLNIVWMEIPGNGKTEFSYLVRPENGMKGTVEMEGTLSVIKGGTVRTSATVSPLIIEIAGTNGILPEELKQRQKTFAATTGKSSSEPAGERQGVVFRIQVSTSAESIPEAKIRKELDLDPSVKITTVKAGNIYKYQAGEFSDYESAGKFLASVRAAGIKDAFMVAYKGGEQIPPGRVRQLK